MSINKMTGNSNDLHIEIQKITIADLQKRIAELEAERTMEIPIAVTDQLVRQQERVAELEGALTNIEDAYRTTARELQQARERNRELEDKAGRVVLAADSSWLASGQGHDFLSSVEELVVALKGGAQ